eukprot:10133154-Alexandrium_andersonii.AAC.1
MTPRHSRTHRHAGSLSNVGPRRRCGDVRGGAPQPRAKPPLTDRCQCRPQGSTGLRPGRAPSAPATGTACTRPHAAPRGPTCSTCTTMPSSTPRCSWLRVWLAHHRTAPVSYTHLTLPTICSV